MKPMETIVLMIFMVMGPGLLTVGIMTPHQGCLETGGIITIFIVLVIAGCLYLRWNKKDNQKKGHENG